EVGCGHHRQPELGERGRRGVPRGLRRHFARRRPHGRGAQHGAPGPRHGARRRGRRPARHRRRRRRHGERGPQRPLQGGHPGHPPFRHGERAGARARAAARARGRVPEDPDRHRLQDGRRGRHGWGGHRAALRLHGRHRLRRRRRKRGRPASQALPEVARLPARRAKGVPKGWPAGAAHTGRRDDPRGPVRRRRQRPVLRGRFRDGRGGIVDERRAAGRPRGQGGAPDAAGRTGPHPGQEAARPHHELVRLA
ncbi:MAG: Transcription regulator [contains diacylglycerol kinase catalytic domain], partial [uncultured Rubrobacteraceae bacterium]